MLTLKQIADQLKIPVSTVRYWRDEFETHIPYSGEGRSRRYPLQTVEMFREIHELTNKKHTFAQIHDYLAIEYGILVEQQQTTTDEQQQLKGAFLEVFNSYKQEVLQELSGYRQEIASLRLVVEDKLDERDRKLMELIREMQHNRLPWWKRWLDKKKDRN